jgi:nodulation protein F
MWDNHFEGILRSYLPFLPAETELAADADLRDLGLDSLGTVELIASLERGYGIRFTDDRLRLELFTTAASVWQNTNALLANA